MNQTSKIFLKLQQLILTHSLLVTYTGCASNTNYDHKQLHSKLMDKKRMNHT